MRNALAAMVLSAAVGLGCSSIASSGLSNGGTPPRRDAGGATTGGPPPGTPCTSNAACGSGVCGLAGTGNCCATACATADATCAASGCNDAGACLYTAVGTNCGPTSCQAQVQSQPQCDGFGHCSAEALSYCPTNVECNDAGTACLSTCGSSADCAKGFACNAGACVTPQSVGPCTENDDCMSGVCGLNGTGHCCAGDCSHAAPCGAVADCDPFSGACGYAGSSVVCQPPICDAGFFEPQSVCNGGDTCVSFQISDCLPFACNSSGCLTSCTADNECVSGYCDVPNSTCCTLTSGSTIAVDSAYGSDATPCCGAPGHPVCQTLAHVMQVIDAAQARDVVIKATTSTAGLWDPPGEVFPIVLGWGAELQAAQITFYDVDAGNRALFEIGAFSPNDHIGYASIVGATVGGEWPADKSTILVDPGSTLYIADATVSSSVTYQNTAIEVSAGAGLVIGQDHLANTVGSVTIGPDPADPVDAGALTFEGYDGIVCDSAKGLGCTISDSKFVDFGSSLTMSMQAHRDLDAEDFAKITLDASPIIGVSHPTGFSGCPSSEDGRLSGNAVLLHGLASVSFAGILQCVSGTGFELEASSSGVPSLSLSGATVENTSVGVHASAGTTTVAGSIIQYNGNGVEQDTDGTNIGTIDLNGAPDAGNGVFCNQGSGFAVGVSVLNTTTKLLDASNVTWDTPGPDVFKCGPGFGNCACEIATCTLDAGANGMDAVYESTGTILTTGNTLLTGSGCVN